MVQRFFCLVSHWAKIKISVSLEGVGENSFPFLFRLLAKLSSMQLWDWGPISLLTVRWGSYSVCRGLPPSPTHISFIFKASNSCWCLFLLKFLCLHFTFALSLPPNLLCLKGSCDYIGFNQVIQDHLPILKFITLIISVISLLPYSQVLGIRVWTFFWRGGHYSALHHPIFWYSVISIVTKALNMVISIGKWLRKKSKSDRRQNLYYFDSNLTHGQLIEHNLNFWCLN